MRGSAFLLALLGGVAGQLNAGSPGISVGDSIFNGSRVCNQTFAQANISQTGVVSLNPDLGIDSGDVHWAVTLHQSPNTTASDDQLTELSLWFSPGSANYSDNAHLGYDACYLWISQIEVNTLARGQNDTGGCMQTLNEECINDINTNARQFANWLTGSPNGNLTADSLPGVCGTLAQQMTDNFPVSCNPFFQTGVRVYGSPPGLGGPLTGPDSFIKRAQCTIRGEPNNSTYALMWSQFAEGGFAIYSLVSWFVTPLVTVFFPIADEERLVTIATSKSFMTCIRTNNVNQDSIPPPPAPTPTPIDSSTNTTSNSSTDSTDLFAAATSPAATSPTADSPGSSTGGLSAGAIAGIAVGVILGILAAAALLALLVFRRRIREKLARRKSGGVVGEMDATSAGRAEMEDASGGRQTATTRGGAPTTEISEMGGTATMERRAELGGGDAGDAAPVEMSATGPVARGKV